MDLATLGMLGLTQVYYSQNFSISNRDISFNIFLDDKVLGPSRQLRHLIRSTSRQCHLHIAHFPRIIRHFVLDLET